METDIASRYTPGQIERIWYERWTRDRCFEPRPSGRDPYTIMIPPPNVTGALHMGHALNNTLQDILIRFRRMRGHQTLWMPGTDHAGIATQTVVEKMLLKQGIKKDDLGREKFIEKVWTWKEEYGGKILGQLEKLGCSCDWSRTRFTMDDMLSKAVRTAFTRLFEKGLIYRGYRLINWDPGTRTALSDDEIEHKDLQSHLYYLRYPVVGDPSRHVVVATTRPETMLGDTGVAVHPADPRYRDLVGKKVLLPLMEREIPVIADETVDPDFGTGAVKVTPAHDHADYERGERHGLPVLNVMNEDGSLNEDAGTYAGLDRFVARKKVLADLESLGLLDHIEDYTHSVGHSYRSGAVIEPLLSEQWFVKMRPLADVAIQASKEGRLRFVPERWERVYLQWLENVRDWCISRQIWWGHRIPVYYDEDGTPAASVEALTVHPVTGKPIVRQDEDVLDTWFSSALWPFSTLGWPDKTPDLERFFPTQTLVTARDIIYLWVGRMVMTSLEFLDRMPFDTVYITATILDEQGRRMSKSLGNGIDPLDMIDQYGADAVRFTLPLLTSEGQDIKLAPTKFEMGRNFMNKLWNACRFALTHLEGEAGSRALGKSPALEDRWILSRLSRVVSAETEALDRFRFFDAAQEIYHFLWDELCDWYLEVVKPRLYDGAGGPESKAHVQATLVTLLDTVLRLLHPFAPYISEEIWSRLRPHLPEGKASDEGLCNGSWPEPATADLDPEAEQEFVRLMDVVRAIRNIRAEYDVAKTQTIAAVLSHEDGDGSLPGEDAREAIRTLCRVESLTVGRGLEKPGKSAVAVAGSVHIHVPLEGIIDLDKEKGRLRDRIDKAKKYLSGLEKKLGNASYVERAPAEVVQRDREKADETRAEIGRLEESLGQL